MLCDKWDLIFHECNIYLSTHPVFDHLPLRLREGKMGSMFYKLIEFSKILKIRRNYKNQKKGEVECLIKKMLLLRYTDLTNRIQQIHKISKHKWDQIDNHANVNDFVNNKKAQPLGWAFSLFHQFNIISIKHSWIINIIIFIKIFLHF